MGKHTLVPVVIGAQTTPWEKDKVEVRLFRVNRVSTSIAFVSVAQFGEAERRPRIKGAPRLKHTKQAESSPESTLSKFMSHRLVRGYMVDSMLKALSAGRTPRRCIRS